MARHALADADKQARREAILEAAGRLFGAGDGVLPSSAQIATAASLAKGTIYLYFRSKEEIFMTLLLRNWIDVLEDAQRIFLRTKGPKSAKVAAFLDHFTRFLRRHPEILRLDALGYTLDLNLDKGVHRSLRLQFVERLAVVGADIDSVLRLAKGRSARLLMRSYALTRGLWQTTHAPDRSAAVADPALALLHPEFWSELFEALTEYWRGALAS
jgi:AcrR family transcriptional regulator